MKTQTVTNEKMRQFADALAEMARQPWIGLAGHRVKVAIRALRPMAAGVGDDIQECITPFGYLQPDGSVVVPEVNIAAANAAIRPILDETVELPVLKPIDWRDVLANKVAISPNSQDILEELGFLTGSPEQENDNARQ